MCRNKGTATHTKHVLKVRETRSHIVLRKGMFKKERKKEKKRKKKTNRKQKKKIKETKQKAVAITFLSTRAPCSF